MKLETVVKAVGFLENNFISIHNRLTESVSEYVQTDIAITNRYYTWVAIIGLILIIAPVVIKLISHDDFDVFSIVIMAIGCIFLFVTVVTILSHVYELEMWANVPGVMTYKTILGWVGQ